jgi:hypothetical protein
VNWPARIIGPIARAGLTPAPLTGPLITMATARTAPMAMAAMPRGTRVSVATATTTRTSTKVATASAARTRPAETPAAGAGAPRAAIDLAWSPYKTQVTAAAAVAPANWAMT